MERCCSSQPQKEEPESHRSYNSQNLWLTRMSASQFTTFRIIEITLALSMTGFVLFFALHPPSTHSIYPTDIESSTQSSGEAVQLQDDGYICTNRSNNRLCGFSGYKYDASRALFSFSSSNRSAETLPENILYGSNNWLGFDVSSRVRCALKCNPDSSQAARRGSDHAARRGKGGGAAAPSNAPTAAPTSAVTAMPASAYSGNTLTPPSRGCR